jgi:hypothetical protein
MPRTRSGRQAGHRIGTRSGPQSAQSLTRHESNALSNRSRTSSRSTAGDHGSWSIDRALIGPRRRKERADLAQVVIHNRLAAIEAQRRDQLPHPLARHLRIAPEQLVDLVVERIQLRSRPFAPIPRRRRRTQRGPDRVAAQPAAPCQLLDRDAAGEVLASQLSPLLHVDQPLPLSLDHKTERGSRSPRTPPPAPRGSIFDRQRGVSFRGMTLRPEGCRPVSAVASVDRDRGFWGEHRMGRPCNG